MKSLPLLTALCGSLLAIPATAQDSSAGRAEPPRHEAPAAVPPVSSDAARPYAENAKNARPPAHGADFGAATDPAHITVPPPEHQPQEPPRPPRPSEKHVWVHGYYHPTAGRWTWTEGAWKVPPTVESVWIDGTYDQKMQHWSEPHWQPDGKVVPPPAPGGPATR